jgi:pimeloyl-ACP methyl ester carboxylesterase
MAYAQSGRKGGKPIVFVPGYGHSRFATGDPEITAALGAMVVGIDLPGIGQSDRHPGYTLLSWADDLIRLADELRLDRFAVAGWSWGAPYALAAAHRHPDRITSVGLVSGLAGWLAGPGAVDDVRPEFRTFATWCRHLKPAARAFLAMQARGFRRDPLGTIVKEASTTGGDDPAIAAEPAVGAMLVASAHEVWDRGGEGTFEHSVAVTQPWGFTLADVVRHVEIWQGTADNEIKPAMAEYAGRNLPDATVHLVEDRGHLLVFAAWAEILASITG